MSLFGDLFHITFKYLLEIISPILGWCSIGTFTNPCGTLLWHGGKLWYIVQWILRSIIGHTHIIPYIIYLFAFDVTAMLLCFIRNYEAPTSAMSAISQDLGCCSALPCVQFSSSVSRWGKAENGPSSKVIAASRSLKKTYFQSSFNFRYQNVTS